MLRSFISSPLRVWKNDSICALSWQQPGRFALGSIQWRLRVSWYLYAQYSMPRSLWKINPLGGCRLRIACISARFVSFTFLRSPKDQPTIRRECTSITVAKYLKRFPNLMYVKSPTHTLLIRSGLGWSILRFPIRLKNRCTLGFLMYTRFTRALSPWVCIICATVFSEHRTPCFISAWYTFGLP